MDHIFWLLDRLLAGRPGPALAPWDPAQFASAGLRAIISLNTEPDPGELAAAGLRHYSLPMTPALPVVAPLQDLLLRELEPVLAAIHAEVSAGQATMVHCHAGKDRTGLALAAYLVRHHNLDVDEALTRLRAVRPIAMSAPGYEATARRFAERERERGESDA